MPELIKAKEKFQFYTRLQLSELTGLEASNITQLLDHIREVPTSCIYYHTHRYLQQHQYLSPEPPNDFAYWVTQYLGEAELGEKLASVDTVQFSTIRSLRERMISVIEEYIKAHPAVRMRFAHEGNEFHFIKSVNFILPTPYRASDLAEFVDVLKKITIDSIYFHIFESRLRLEKGTNDFSRWIEASFGDKDLAYRISTLDPYTHTLEHLRTTIINIIERKVALAWQH